MKQFEILKYISAATCFSAVSSMASDAVVSDRPNVLFIAVDDLRPALGCYGDSVAITPNIDRLASRSMMFQSAYCQIAVCNPSRASLLTGCRPDTVEVWDLHGHFREAKPDIVTLPQNFKEHGYSTWAIGKIFHNNGLAARDPLSWSIPPVYDLVSGDAYAQIDTEIENDYLRELTVNPSKWRRGSIECVEAPDEAYIDGAVARLACSALADYRRSGESFFLAVGFRKPHLPFAVPKKYWDLYERDAIPAPESYSYPAGAPELAIRHWRELQDFGDVKDETAVPIEKMKELRHGYYACVSFIDAQVGRILEELDRQGMTRNTLIVLWGDHGFHLGEQGLWTKSKNYEWTTHSPLIFTIPGVTDRGMETAALVEFVDIYPTLSELCRLPLPAGQVEGVSMVPLFDDPDRSWKKAAFSQFSRDLDPTVYRHTGHGDTVGRAIRTERYRYVEWRLWDSGKLLARELYDHRNDDREMVNVADSPEYAGTIDELSRVLQEGWKESLPPELKDAVIK